MPRVLIAEDMLDTREVLQIGLQRAGFEVFLAGDGEDALRMAGEIGCDILLLDLRLPKLDGMAVLRRLRAEVQRPLPVILMTASSNAAELERGLAAGAIAYLIKPFRIAEMVSTIQRYLG